MCDMDQFTILYSRSMSVLEFMLMRHIILPRDTMHSAVLVFVNMSVCLPVCQLIF